MQGINLETFLNSEIEIVIKEIHSLNKTKPKTESLKTYKQQLKEMQEVFRKIKSHLFTLPDFANTQVIADSLEEGKLKELETKWVSKISTGKGQWRSTKLHQRLYGFLSPQKCDSWDDEKLDEFVDSIKFL